MQDTARPTTGALLEQAGSEPAGAQLADVPAADTFRCRECNRTLPAAMLAFDGGTRGEGVCLTCDGEWPLGIVAAAADDGRYSLMGREVL